jgi:serine phosphatase RsbU (regulator of sigma subunit)
LSLNDRVGDLLPRLNEAFPADLLDVLGSFLQKEAGASDVALLLADYDLKELRSLRPGDRAVVGEWVPLVGSDAGRCFATQATVAVPTGDDVRIHVPVTLRAERIGVLSVVLAEPTNADALRGLEGVATTLAYVMQAATNYTDVFEQARRRKPLTLEAEMQWAMQPVQAFASEQFALAGQLVPAYDVGGDNYDWVINRDTVCIAAIDAMGHGVNASLLGALGMTALRNARRAGATLGERAAQADRAIYRQFGGAQFVTGFSMEIDMASGAAIAVTAGHPPPYLLRSGRVTPLELPAQLPLGLFEMTHYDEVPVDLQPGDRLMIVSDGVLEAAPAGGHDEFGEERLEGVIGATASEPPHEAVRHTVEALLDYQQGHLRDDATILVFDWRPRSGPAGSEVG